MIIGAYQGCLTEAQAYYAQSRTMVLLFSNSFNIFYIIIVPFVFHKLSQFYHYILVTAVSVYGIAVILFCLAGRNYWPAISSVAVIAIANISMITAPYGLLKLLPKHHHGYAMSIPLFVPQLGMSFCIIYARSYIVQNPAFISEIDNLLRIIAIFGAASCLLALVLIYFLYSRIADPNYRVEEEHQ